MFHFLGAVIELDGRDDVQDLRHKTGQQDHHEDGEHDGHGPVDHGQ
jgi:hypothetical protein